MASVKANESLPLKFLSEDEAFKYSMRIINVSGSQILRITWTISEGYYLYQERFSFFTSPEMKLSPAYSKSINEYDEFTGHEMKLLSGVATVDIEVDKDIKEFDLKMSFQGCAIAGLCYSPSIKRLHINTKELVSK